MIMQDIPTPETDKAWESPAASKFHRGLNMRDSSRDLERRLTVAREALEKIANAETRYPAIIATKALTLTASKS